MIGSRESVQFGEPGLTELSFEIPDGACCWSFDLVGSLSERDHARNEFIKKLASQMRWNRYSRWALLA